MEKNWYVVHTYSGFEKFVAESIRQRAIELNIEEQIGKIIIPNVKMDLKNNRGEIIKVKTVKEAIGRVIIK